MSEIKVQHRSFSSFTSWLRCGKAWQLERGMQAPSEPAWWFVGGSAFHLAAEKYLLQKFDGTKDTKEIFPF
jgi:putative RecB family exonuclease